MRFEDFNYVLEFFQALMDKMKETESPGGSSTASSRDASPCRDFSPLITNSLQVIAFTTCKKKNLAVNSIHILKFINFLFYKNI